MEREDGYLIDGWLEDAYESRVTLDYEERPVQPSMWEQDAGDEDEETICKTQPSTNGTHSATPVSVAPLQQKIDAALDDLAAQLAAGHTDAFRKLCAFYSRFHHYSLANSILIMLQKPDANAVAGYVRWKQLGRQVRKHAKAAQIWCPIKLKADDESDEEELMLLAFKTCYVFSDKDLIDADTKPVPVSRPPLADNYPKLLARLLLAVGGSGVAIKYVPHISGAEGYYRRDTHQIVLEEGRDSHNQVLILLHEWAHALFHHDEDAANWPKAMKEFQAETVAMVMGHLLGVASPYANDYLLHFGASPEQLKSSFGHIHALVGQMSHHLKIPSTAM